MSREHAVKINIDIIIMVHDQAERTKVRSYFRLGKINILAKPDR